MILLPLCYYLNPKFVIVTISLKILNLLLFALNSLLITKIELDFDKLLALNAILSKNSHQSHQSHTKKTLDLE